MFREPDAGSLLTGAENGVGPRRGASGAQRRTGGRGGIGRWRAEREGRKNII